MKGSLKRILSVVLTGLIAVSTGLLSGSVALAANVVAIVDVSNRDSISHNTYNQYEKAWNDALSTVDGERKTLKLLSDWTISSELVVPDGKSINVDMNGHIIRRVARGILFKSGGPVIKVGKNANFNLDSSDNSLVHAGHVKDRLWLLGNDELNESSNVNFSGGIITGGTSIGSKGYNTIYGSGIVIEDGADVTLKNVCIVGNKTDSVGGGIIKEGTRGTLNLNSNCVIAYNSSSFNGGGIAMDGGQVIMHDNSKVSCNFASQHGGGVCMSGGQLEINDESCISNNLASYNGGGIYIYPWSQCKLSMNGHSKVSGNDAHRGGGIYLAHNYSERPTTITMSDNSEISSNRALHSDGGGILSNCSEVKIVMRGNSRIHSNYAKSLGDGICVGGCNNQICLSNNNIVQSVHMGCSELCETDTGDDYLCMGSDLKIDYRRHGVGNQPNEDPQGEQVAPNPDPV